jgi:hypothetical protein
LNKAIEYAGGDPQHVIVLSIPDWGVTPFAQGRDIQQVANQIDSFNAVNKGETERPAHTILILRQFPAKPAGTPLCLRPMDCILLVRCMHNGLNLYCLLF